MIPKDYDKFFLNKNLQRRGRLIAEGLLFIVVQLADSSCWVWPLSECVEIV